VIQGRIVQLRSDTPPTVEEQGEFEHTITMYWEREKGRSIKVRVPLTIPQYRDACDAHKNGRLIRVYGIPEKSGKFWRLTLPHDFSVL